MPTHWTYEACDDASELEQGDILRPTDKLKAIFADVHPHFQGDKYLGFLVATQSCDLVRRGPTVKATYINVAVIRPLAQVLRKVLSQVIASFGDGVFRTEDKLDAKRLIGRLLNQNEQSLGLFYLHGDIDAGIGEAAVAFLRVTVALRSEHYDVLREARCGRLTSEFRAKLGWLIGNLYVRPATPDWQDKDGGKKAFDRLVKEYLADAKWIDDEIVQQAKAQGVDLAQATPESLEALRPTSRLERALNEVKAELSIVAPTMPDADVTKLTNLLKNNNTFTKLLKAAALEVPPPTE